MRGRSYPVLYLNDGQNLFEPERAFAGVTWRAGEAAAGLIRRRAIPPLIIVGIDHGESRRALEYLPVSDHPENDARYPLGAQYAAFVTQEVMPIIMHRYPIAHGARYTGLGGSSYGALAALYTALLRPGVFGRLLLESPSLYVGNRYLLRRARVAKRWPSRIYLGVGTMETNRRDVNTETVANVLAFGRILRTAGLGPRRLQVRVEEGAAHTEAAWAERFPKALTFLFRK
jgi:predicted alpha/beta superfamily hydrolase